MIRGLTTAAAGMLADERYQQLLANNLANAETPGFKPSAGEVLSFPEQLLRVWDYAQGTVENPIGTLTTGAVFQEGVPLFLQGDLTHTGRNLDVAIEDAAGGTNQGGGSGAATGWRSFFAVAYRSAQGQTGLVLTRDGHFDTDRNGVLVDAGGHPVLPVDAAGRPLFNARIVINPAYQGQDLFQENGAPRTDASGQPSYFVKPANNLNGPAIPGARLGVVDANVSQLSPLGDTEWQVGPNLSANPPAGALRAGTGTLTPGALEASGVDETATLTRMMAAVAQYEANQRVIQVEDAELGKAVTDVGKVNA